jgi:hypothetical protein
MDLRSTTFKVHVVHVGLHQVEAVTMFARAITSKAVTYDAFEIKSFALVGNHNGYFAAGLTSTTYVYFY